MEYKYLITDIQEKTKVSITSLTTFKNKHKDFFNNNSTRKHRKIYYNQAAMDFFLSYYAPDTDTEKKIPDKIIDTEKAEEQAENPVKKTSYTDRPQEREEEVSKAEIEALKAEIAALKKQLEETETEKKELFRQNSQLLLLLQQEKQEKMLLLPAPKKPFSEKVKSIFKGRPQT